MEYGSKEYYRAACKELDWVKSALEVEVCQRFNADTKAEYIAVLEEELSFMERNYNY